MGKQIGTPPLIALEPSSTAFFETKMSSWPSTIHEMIVPPKGTTVNDELPLPCFSSIFLIGEEGADIVKAFGKKKIETEDPKIRFYV